MDLSLCWSLHCFAQLYVNVNRKDAQVHELVVVDAEDSDPLALVLLPPSFDDGLLSMKEISMGCLLWVRGQVLRTVLGVDRLLG